MNFVFTSLNLPLQTLISWKWSRPFPLCVRHQASSFCFYVIESEAPDLTLMEMVLPLTIMLCKMLGKFVFFLHQ